MTRAFLHRAFVAPWSSPQRAATYAGMFFGVAGFNLLALLFSWQLAAAGLRDLLIFWAVYFFVSGPVLTPLLYGLYAKHGVKKARLVYIGCLLPGFAALIPGGVAMSAIANALVSMPFWTAYHLTLSGHSTDDNRGHEIANAYIANAVGAVTGFMIGGALANSTHLSIGLGFAAMALGLLLILTVLPPPHKGEDKAFWHDFRDHLFSRDMRMAMTVGQGGYDIFSSFILPSFLQLIGTNAMGAGVVQTLRVGLGSLVAPAIGHIVGKGKHHELRWGSLLYVPAWAAMLLPLPLPVQLAIAIAFWTVSTRAYGIGLDAAWYRLRTPGSLAARETLLSAGRIPFLLAFVPVMFISTKYYILLALAYGFILAMVMWRVTTPAIPQE